ncbi:uncharacterized protein LOC126906598 [Daktulosphaira vitifoliae]|uniref:uncharacterized protein LOC126906598 n=1 Tax=Daktulosphaira vitifoliae TaxID=58002 RepID=UPI0021A9F2E5|nr:uncharacterized protein LOC126906598 [Daktulosphaira vitifoliae]
MDGAKSKNYPFIITPIKKIVGNRLPSKREVLGYFLYFPNVNKKTISVSASMCATHLIEIWSKTNILIKHTCHIVTRIKKLHTKWMNVNKNKNRISTTQNNDEAAFVESLNYLFDISLANALNSDLSKEEKDFLVTQREMDCSRTVIPNFKKVIPKNTRSNNKKVIEFKELERRTGKKLESLSSTDDSSHNTSHSEFECDIEKPTTSKTRLKIMTPHLTSALDRTNVSNRNATYILAAILTNSDTEIKDVSISKDTIRRARISDRKIISEEILNLFKPHCTLMVTLGLHSDGKMLPSDKKYVVDRLAVIVSVDGNTKLLGVP